MDVSIGEQKFFSLLAPSQQAPGTSSIVTVE